MKQLAGPLALPSLLTALERALARGPCQLDRAVPNAIWRRALSGPAAEFLARPGKEVRSAIVRAGWLLGGGDPAGGYERIALVIELLHAGSLIIDDVEDGSQARRDAPALHALVGVPLAINTGSWMYFWALSELGALGLPPASQLAAHQLAVTTLARCHQGQALDLAVRVCDLDVVEVGRVVEATTRLKTGALCRLAAELGALAAGADAARRDTVAEFGETLGIGLQMLDDIGSIASAARAAKGREDLRAGRPTWPWAWLAEASPFAWSRLIERERAVVAGHGDPDAVMAELAREVEPVGRAAAHATLASAHASLVAAFGPGPIIDGIAADAARLERSYG